MFKNYSCDRQFLAFAQRYITIPALIAALKVMLVLGDPPSKEEGSRIYNVDEDELSDFAKHILKKICSQKWVHNRCLQVCNNTKKYYISFKYFHHGAISINDEFVHILSKQI